MLSVREAKIDLSRYGTVGVIGEIDDDAEFSNGAGKSSLVECFLLAWYGKGRVDIFNAIKDDAEEGEIHLKWIGDEGGKQMPLKVIRKANRKTREHVRELYINDSKTPFGGGKTGTDKYIENVLGLDFDTAIATNFFMQRKDDAFTSLKPGKRKDYLKKIINTELYDLAYEKVKLTVSDLEKRLAAARLETEAYQKELDELSTINFEDKVKEAKANIQKCVDVMKEYTIKLEDNKNKVKGIEGAVLQQEDMKKTVGVLRDRLTNIDNSKKESVENSVNLRNQAAIIENAKVELTKLPDYSFDEEKFNGLAIEGTKLNKDKGVYEGKIKIYEEITKEMQGLAENCALCRQKITQKHTEAIIKEQKVLIDDNNIKIKEIESSLTKLREEYTKLNAIKIKKDMVNNQKLKLEGIVKNEDNNTSMLNLLKETISKLDEERKGVELQYNSGLESIKNSPQIDEAFLNKMQRECEALAKDIEKTKDIQNQYYSYVGSLETKQARIPELDDKIKKIEDSTKDDAYNVRVYKILMEAYSKNGIPALIVDNMFPIIEETANYILSQFDNKRVIEFSSLKEKVGGGSSESLDIWIHNLVKDTKRLYETYSGGESTGINLSLRKALSDLLAKRKYKRLPFLVLDEVFAALDRRHRNFVIQIINLLEKDFSQIFIISHTELQSAFPQIIKAVKKDEDTVYVQ